MESILQESAGLRRTAAIQSPIPVTGRLSIGQRIVVGIFLVMLVLTHLVQLLPPRHSVAPVAVPRTAGR